MSLLRPSKGNALSAIGLFAKGLGLGGGAGSGSGGGLPCTLLVIRAGASSFFIGFIFSNR
jgi:hypothetical protein